MDTKEHDPNFSRNMVRLLDAALTEETKELKDYWGARYSELYLEGYIDIVLDNSGDDGSGYLVSVDLEKFCEENPDDDSMRVNIEKLAYTISVIARLLITSRLAEGDLEGFGLSNLEAMMDKLGIEQDADNYEKVRDTLMELTLTTFSATTNLLTNDIPEQ